jgi:acyl-coenzyme A thioesterase PaaI-like protein
VDSNLVKHGEWAGWHRPDTDPFELHAGPFYCRRTADGSRLAAFRASRQHLNMLKSVHGGCLMAFADFSLFWIAHDELAGIGAVTASFNSEFLDAAKEGELIESSGEVLRATGSMIFVRGLITSERRALLGFSAILKKTRAKTYAVNLPCKTGRDSGRND